MTDWYDMGPSASEVIARVRRQTERAYAQTRAEYADSGEAQSGPVAPESRPVEAPAGTARPDRSGRAGGGFQRRSQWFLGGAAAILGIAIAGLLAVKPFSLPAGRGEGVPLAVDAAGQEYRAGITVAAVAESTLESPDLSVPVRSAVYVAPATPPAGEGAESPAEPVTAGLETLPLLPNETVPEDVPEAGLVVDSAGVAPESGGDSEVLAGANATDSPEAVAVGDSVPVPEPPPADIRGLIEQESPVTRHVVTIQPGDTMIGLLRGVDVPAADALSAIRELEPDFDPATLRTGAKLEFVIDTPVASEEEEAPSKLLALTVSQRRKGEDHSYAWSGDSFAGRTVIDIIDGVAGLRETIPAEWEWTYYAGEIESTFYEAALEEGLSAREVHGLVRILEGSVDFSRDMRVGDTFEALTARKEDARSQVFYVGLNRRNSRDSYYRADFVDGTSGYFDREGNSHVNLINNRPLRGARVTSGFGRRMHPIRKVIHQHTGTDFRAPHGTAIPAAGNGIVVQQGWRGGYGRYLRIRHNSTYMTGYAHLQGFADGLRVGKRVKRGQTIGYVGSSGLSTGPHLHFEVYRDGRAINPLKLESVRERRLVGDVFDAFRVQIDVVEARLAAKRENALAQVN